MTTEIEKLKLELTRHFNYKNLQRTSQISQSIPNKEMLLHPTKTIQEILRYLLVMITDPQNT